MKLVMTLLVRDEADIVDAQIAFHLDAGVDFVVATDNRSRGRHDGDPRALRARGAPAPHPRAGRRPAPERVGDADGAPRGDRLRRGLGAQHGRRRVLVAAGGDFRALFAAVPDALRRRPRRVAQLRAAPRRRPVLRRAHDRAALPAVVPSPSAQHALQVGASRRRGRPRRPRQPRGVRRRASSPLRGWYPIEILHFPVRSLEHCMRKYVTQFVALERNAEKGIPGHMAEAYRAYRAGGSRSSTRRSSSTTRRSSAGSSAASSRSTRGCATGLRALGFGAAPDASDAARSPTTLDADAAFAGEYSALREADLGRRVRRRRVDELERASRLAASRRSAVAAAMSAAWRRLLAFVPTRRAARRALRARVRRLLDRVARLADGEGPRHLGLPRVLPPALRLRAAALRAPALPHAADADRRRAAARSRRHLAPRGRVRAPLRDLDPRLERDGAHLRSHSRALQRRAAARLSGVRDALPPGVERRRVRDRARGLGAAPRRARSTGRRPGASSRSGAGSPCSSSSGRRTRSCCRSPSSRRSSRTSPGAGASRWRPCASRAAVLPLAAWAAAQRRPLRRRDRRARRTRLGAVPAGLHVEQDDRARERRRPRERLARARSSDEVLAEGPAREPRRAARRVPAKRHRTTRRSA